MKTEHVFPPPRISSLSRVAARVAIAGSIAVLVLLASLHVLSPEFDPSFRMISEYAFGDYGWILSLMFLVWGLSTWALSIAIWTQISTTRGRLGRWFLLAAGLGEVMAAAFDIRHDLGHALAGLLGVGGLPVAALLISASLDRAPSWARTGPRWRRWCSHLPWMSVVLLVATMALMTMQFIHVNGGHLPEHAPKTLPPGVFGLDGWANRLIVVANCLWVVVVARQAIVIRGATVAPANRVSDGRISFPGTPAVG